MALFKSTHLPPVKFLFLMELQISTQKGFLALKKKLGFSTYPDGNMKKFYRILDSEKNWRLWRCHWTALKVSGPKVGDTLLTQRHRQLVWRYRGKMMWKIEETENFWFRKKKKKRNKGLSQGRRERPDVGWQMTTSKSTSLLRWVGICLSVSVDVSMTLILPFLSELED